MLAVGSDEGDVVAFGVVLVDVHHHGLVAKRLGFAVYLYLTKGVPAVGLVTCFLFFIGVDEEVDPIAHVDIIESRWKSEKELMVVLLVYAKLLVGILKVVETLYCFFQLCLVHVIDSDDTIDGGVGELLKIVLTRVGFLIKIEDDDGKEGQ